MQRNGYITFDFIPWQENRDTKAVDMSKKKSIVITMKNVSEIMDLDTRNPYNQERDEEGSYI